MSNELIINSTSSGFRIALLKDKTLVEFHHEVDGNNFAVGDICLGNVKKVVQGLNAAFVNIGHEKDAFLHYFDLGSKINSLKDFTKEMSTTKREVNGSLSKFKIRPIIEKNGKINNVLSKNQQILVQVIKEPISTKGPRLSCELSIPGRYLVLVPFSDSVNVSKKIGSNEERKRLHRLVSSIKPEKFGVIIRTVAEGRDVKELDLDLRSSLELWNNGIKKLKTAKVGDKIIGEISRTSSILRDVLNESFDNIYIDDKNLFDEIKTYIHTIAPEKENIVKFFNKKAKIFEVFGIEKQIKSAFGKTVNVRGGGYLVIEHTEALHVIDVNSGNKSNREEDQEATALSVNTEAAKEIARQLRLRDMGGIIVIDFIDMKKIENKRYIQQIVKEEMKSDRSRSTILPLSKFGLMQITRQRVRSEMNIATQETCPSCNGTGKIGASILLADEIEDKIKVMFVENKMKSLILTLHPYIYVYFTSSIFSKQLKWFFKYGKWVQLIQDSSLAITEYYFTDKLGENIVLEI